MPIWRNQHVISSIALAFQLLISCPVRRILLGKITGQLAESRHALGPFQERRNKNWGVIPTCHPLRIMLHAALEETRRSLPRAENHPDTLAVLTATSPLLQITARALDCSSAARQSQNRPTVGDSRGAVSRPTQRLVEATFSCNLTWAIPNRLPSASASYLVATRESGIIHWTACHTKPGQL